MFLEDRASLSRSVSNGIDPRIDFLFAGSCGMVICGMIFGIHMGGAVVISCICLL